MFKFRTLLLSLTLSLTVFLISILNPSATQAQIDPTSCACILANYMNAVIDAVKNNNLTNIKVLTPAFALTSEQELYQQMSQCSAHFNDVDGFAGNSYTLEAGGQIITAYEWYTRNGWRDAVLKHGQQMYFTEWGDFYHDIGRMTNQHFFASSDFTVALINYFNALGINNQFTYAALSSSEYSTITASNRSKAGINTAWAINPDHVYQARAYGAKSVVEIEFDDKEADAATYVNTALSEGLRPILRICAGDSCVFQDVNKYIEYLKRLNTQIRGPVYIIAGPNEPSLEHWLCNPGGNSSCLTNPFDPDQFVCDVYDSGDKITALRGQSPDKLSSPEYNSLRPYPTCPITPQIRDTTYYSCGNDLTATETFTLHHPDDPSYSGNPLGVNLIECIENPPDTFTCSYTVNRDLPITINFDRSELPFLGLTRSPYLENSENDNVATADYKLKPGQKMNHYLSWYLNGTIDRAENTPLASMKDYPAANPDSSPEGAKRAFDDTQELLLYSGPLRKLEPWYIQNIHHLTNSTSREDQIVRANLPPSTQTLPFDHYTRRHDQIATCIIDMEGGTLEALHTIADFLLSIIFAIAPGDYQTTDVVTDIPAPCYVKPPEEPVNIPGWFDGKIETEGNQGDLMIKINIPILSDLTIRLKRIRLSGDGNDALQQHGWDKDNKLPPDREDPRYESSAQWFQALKIWYGEICSPVFNLGIEFYFCFDEGEFNAPDFLRPNYWGTTYSYIPFSSTEDMTGFAQVSTTFAPEPADDITESRPTIFTPKPIDPDCDGGFRNLYFSHIEEDTELGRQLQRTFMPHGDAGFDNLQTRGLYDTQFCDLTNSLANPGDYLRPEYETSTSPQVVAPRATIDPFATYDYRDQLNIDGNLNYDGTFTCTFIRSGGINEEGILCGGFAPPGSAHCNQDSPEINPELGCHQVTCDPEGSGEWIDQGYCETCCPPNPADWSLCLPAAAEPESWTTCSITAADTTSLYIAMPRTEELWERFVVGDMSIVRKIFPRLGPDRPIVEFQDVPAYTFATYASYTGPDATGGSTIVGNPATGERGSAGTLLTGEIYFPHLGSINTYFLKEVQRALRPKEFGGYIEPGHPLPPSVGECSQLTIDIPYRNSSAPVANKETFLNNLDKFGGQLLGNCGFSQNIINQIKQNFNAVPGSPFNTYPTRFDAVVGACRSAGYNPNFCLTIWLEESAAGVWDNEFGCGFTTSFETSLECFLSRYDFYSTNPLYSTCNADGLSFEEFMIIYSEGNCNPETTSAGFCLNPNFPGRVQTIYNAVLDPTQSSNPGIVSPCI